MAVKIRLKRMGKIRAPFYRVVIMDSRTKRDGRAIEEIGKYQPTHDPSVIDINSERAQYWLGQGAQPTEAVMALLKITGDWQKFTGEKGAEGTLKVAEPKTSKKDLYEAALAASGDPEEAKKKAADAKKKAADEAKAAAKAAKEAEKAEAEAAAAAEAKAADEAKADEAAAEAPAEEAAEATKDEAPAEETTAAKDEAPEAKEDAPAAKDEAKAEPKAEASDELPKGAAAATEDGAAPEGFPIKGNKDSMKFHEPDGQWYEQTVAELWFDTAANAEAAGFTKAGA